MWVKYEENPGERHRTHSTTPSTAKQKAMVSYEPISWGSQAVLCGGIGIIGARYQPDPCD